jgi:CheY-like chemotaxis protein
MEKGNTGNGKKILVIQKSTPTLKNIAFLLEQKNYQVSLSGDKSSAVSLLEKRRADAVIADLEIFTPQEISNNLTKGIPLLLTVTAQERLSLDEKSIPGASAMVTKPFSADSLIKSIEELLNE